MGSKRLANCLAVTSLLSAIHVNAIELDKGQSMLSLVEQGCAYGRGALAIESAKADALNNLRLFLNGQTSVSFSTADSELFNEAFNETTRELLVSGIEKGRVKAQFETPEIMGDDTCVTARLAPPKSSSHTTNTDVTWDESPTMSVVVSGEGKASQSQGLSAREAAEQDAFRRAISQVVGVMVKSGYLQQSYSSMSASEMSDDFDLHEVAKQSLSMQSEGMISGWNEISSKKQPNGTVVVTLDVSVERQKVQDKTMQLIERLGQPSVYIDATLPFVRMNASRALSEMGFDIAPSVVQSSIILSVKEQRKITPSGLQLDLKAEIRDRSGNIYGMWNNNPSFITLPNKAAMLNELASVHLSLEDNKTQLSHVLHQSVQKMAMRGGPFRELIFSSRAAGKQGQLHTMLSAINGVSDVKIETRGSKVVVKLRSLNNASELAQYLEPTLRIHQPNYSSKLQVLNENQINVL